MEGEKSKGKQEAQSGGLGKTANHRKYVTKAKKLLSMEIDTTSYEDKNGEKNNYVTGGC
jgi:hypothetical protein